MSSDTIAEGTIQNIVAAQFAPEEFVATTRDAPVSPDEAEAMATEDELARALSVSLDSGSDIPRGVTKPEELTQEELAAVRNKLMKRAARQRKAGSRALQRDEMGVAIHRQQVAIKDRVMGSAFIRFFSAIDVCAGLLQRRGEMLLGEAKSDELLERLTALIDEFADDAAKELGRVEIMVNDMREQLLGEGDEFITPKVDHPALAEEVVIGTRLGLKLYRAVRKYDDALEMMSTLSWNDGVSDKEIGNRQLLVKQALGKLYGFAARTNMGLYSRGFGRRTPRPHKTTSAKLEAGTAAPVDDFGAQSPIATPTEQEASALEHAPALEVGE